MNRTCLRLKEESIFQAEKASMCHKIHGITESCDIKAQVTYGGESERVSLSVMFDSFQAHGL